MRTGYFLARGEFFGFTVEKALVGVDPMKTEKDLDGFVAWLFLDAKQPEKKRDVKIKLKMQYVDKCSFVPHWHCKCIRDDGIQFSVNISEEILADLKALFGHVWFPEEVMSHIGEVLP